MEERVPVVLLTKNADFTKEYCYENIRWRLTTNSYGHNVAFGWTLTGRNELEQNAHSNEMRMQDMSRVYRDGFKTWASIEPVIDFPSSLDMIKQALDAGCQHFKIGLLTSNTHVVRKDFQFGEHHFDAYNRDECIDFIHDVMRIVEAGDGKATVYWKQSFRDFLGEEDFTRATVGYNNIVGKDWSMFKKED
jgi:hypothetical protein